MNKNTRHTGEGRLHSYKQNYVPKLSEGNPLKMPKTDWWDDICEANGEVNHFPKYKKTTYRGDSRLDD